METKASKDRLPSKGRGRPKVTNDKTHREKIAQAAWDLLLERGYSGMTMADVAKHARMSLKTIYRLFPTKLDVVGATVALHRQSIIALPADYDDLPTVDALMKIFHADMDSNTGMQRHAMLAMLFSESQRTPELVPVFLKNGPEQGFLLLREWLERQHNIGRIHIRNSDITGKMLMDIAFGAQVASNWPHGPWPGGDNRTGYLQECFTLIVNGLRPRSAKDVIRDR